MARAKKPSSRKRRTTVLPALGAGVSLAMVGGASASTTAPTTDVGSQANNPTITLHEEELDDVNLGTFYVFDKEHGTLRDNVKLAARGCGGGGRGCGGGGRGCGAGGRGGCAAGGRGCAAGGRGCRGCRGCGVGVRGCGVGCAVGCSCGGCSGACWLWTPAGWVYTC